MAACGVAMPCETNDNCRMRTNAAGVELIQNSETCRLQAYWDDMAKVWSVGWGHTGDVQEGDLCTQAEADEWLAADIASAEHGVMVCLPDVALTNNQLSALVSFCYNVGFGRTAGGKDPGKDGFRVLKNGQPSTMRLCLLNTEYAAAADEFPKWANAGGRPVAGLMTRRLKEKALFLAPDAPGQGGDNGED